jgi:hypothetical protein
MMMRSPPARTSVSRVTGDPSESDGGDKAQYSPAKPAVGSDSDTQHAAPPSLLCLAPLAPGTPVSRSAVEMPRKRPKSGRFQDSQAAFTTKTAQFLQSLFVPLARQIDAINSTNRATLGQGHCKTVKASPTRPPAYCKAA